LPAPNLPVARPLSWSDVRGGAIAAFVLITAGALIMKYSQLGRLHGKTYPLTAFMSEARGVLVGSEVWLSGQKVGKITAIHFRPTSADTTERVEIQMEMLEQYRNAMRKDAVAQIRNGGTIIGAPVVYLTAGTVAAREMRPGDTLRSKPQVDLEGASGKFGTAAKEFPAIINNIKQITTQVKGTSGTAGAFLNSPGGPGSPDIARTRRELSRLGASLSRGNDATSARRREEVMLRAKRVMAKVDSVKTLVSSSSTSLGRLRKDSTLLAEVGDIRRQLTTIRTALDQSEGTAGRVLHDSALTSAVGDAQREMSALFADIKKHPTRYIRF
jgi:phospholipid/cholesterol/gamma-HCH transport system substrate-binding protein